MNNREQLLADTFGNTDGDKFSHVAAAHARRRRAGRQAVLVAGLGLAIGTAIFSIREPRAQPPIATVLPTPAPVLEIISDQELIAELRDQPVLYLKDQTRITGVVFLADQKTEIKL